MSVTEKKENSPRTATAIWLPVPNSVDG